MSAAANGPLRTGSVGPYIPTMGAPTAAAKCRGPVSPPMKSLARLAKAMNCTRVVGRVARPFDPSAFEDFSDHRLFPGRAGQKDLLAPGVFQTPDQRGVVLRRPAFRAPAPARVHDDEISGSKPGDLARHVCVVLFVPRQGKLPALGARPQPFDQGQVFFHHVDAFARRNPLGVENRRAGLTQPPLGKSDAFLGAAEPRHHRGLPESLEVEGRAVEGPAQVAHTLPDFQPGCGRGQMFTPSQGIECHDAVKMRVALQQQA